MTTSENDPMKECTKEEFDQYLNEYQGTLRGTVCHICMPPVINYNDFKLGNWPESMVAMKKPIWGIGDDLYADTGKFKYWIKGE